jgi:AraC-like DNA-binding protein
MPFAESSLLSNFPVIRTSDPVLAAQRLRDGYGATRAHVRSGPDKFSLHANNLQMVDLGLSYTATTGLVAVDFPSASFVRQIFNIQGAGRVTFGSWSEPIRPGLWTSVLPAGMASSIELGPNYSQLVLRIEVAALRRYMSALIGREADRELVFSPQTSVGNPAMHALKLRVFQFASDFNSRGIYFSSLANAEVERMMIMKFLMCHRHNYSDLLLREPIPTSASPVKLAEEYIEANWDKPFDIAELARVANVSARSLFRQFQKERGYSPAEFAKRRRLRMALVLLENSEPSTSVTQVALKCGFHNSGHFARDYRMAFGEMPSETLTRSRKAH